MGAMKALYPENSGAKSMEQLQLCTEVMARERNLIGVLPTGGGKSTSWLIASSLDQEPEITVVVVPFAGLLTQHLVTATNKHKLRAMKWTVHDLGRGIPKDVNLLFMACETVKSKGFLG